MQVTVESTGNLERKMTIQVPAERIEDEVSNRLRSLAGRVKIDGFRPGKVPFKVVKSKFDGQVRQEVLGEVVQSTFQEALAQEQLKPAGGPSIAPKEFKPGEALEYTATFEVFPEIQLASIESAAIEKPVVDINDAEIDAMFEKLRKQRATWTTVERAAQTDDQVTVNFEGTVDGQPFEGNKADNFKLVLGSGQMIPGFEDQVSGAKAGEHRTVEVSFPEDYHAKELAGKAANFEVDVVTVQEPQLPELNDDFAKSFGINEGLDAFRTEVRKSMETELEQTLSNRIKKDVMDALLEANPIEVPKALIDDEAQRLSQQAQSSMQQQGQSQGFTLPVELFQDEARRRVALGLLMEEITKANAISVDPERVETTLQRVASSYEHPEQVIAAYKQDRKLMISLQGLALEEQIVDLLLQQAQVTEKKLSFDEVMNPANK